MKRSFVYWIILGILIVPLNAILHELGHYLYYYFSGAENIVLHYSSVSSDSTGLTATQKGIAAITGPLVSYAMLIAAIIATRNSIKPFWVIMGFVTTLRGLVNLPFIAAHLNGRSPNPNFDEYNFSNHMDLNPLTIAVITIAVIFAAVIYFAVKIYREEKIAGVAKLLIASIIELVCWGSFGKFVLP